MSITAVNAGARDDEFSGAGAETTRAGRLQLIRTERPREQDEGRRFLIVANASRRIARASSKAECYGALQAALVPALADRCTIHEAYRRGESAPAGTRPLRLSSLPDGHPLRECSRTRSSLLFSTTSSAMLRTLDTCGADAAAGMAGCVHVLLAPTVLSRRLVVLALLRGFARGPFDADDLLVAELALSRLPPALRREGARFRG